MASRREGLSLRFASPRFTLSASGRAVPMRERHVHLALFGKSEDKQDNDRWSERQFGYDHIRLFRYALPGSVCRSARQAIEIHARACLPSRAICQLCPAGRQAGWLAGRTAPLGDLQTAPRASFARRQPSMPKSTPPRCFSRLTLDRLQEQKSQREPIISSYVLVAAHAVGSRCRSAITSNAGAQATNSTTGPHEDHGG